MRFATSSLTIFLLAVACGDGGNNPGTSPTSTGSTAGGSTTATPTTTAVGTTAMSTSTTGGTAATGGAGGATSGPVTTTTGGSTTGGFAGFDNGGLFGPDSSVPISAGGDTGDGGVPEAAPISDVSNGPPGDGNVATSHIVGTASGTAEFTQTGVDVTVVVKLTVCANGTHSIRIHGGFSCDTAATEGDVWDGKRGDGIGGAASTITCAANTGTLTYTRLGNDPTTNWTVADHNLATDVTSHVVIVSDGTNRIACGNFF